MRSNNLKNKNGRKKGSVLVYAIIVLSIMLMSGLAISSTAVRSTKGAISGDKSAQAFQLAESGIEIVLKDFKDFQDAAIAGSYFNVIKIEDVGNKTDSSCGGASCSRDQCADGVLTINIKTISSESADKVDMNFEDFNGDPIACDGSLSGIRNIKSIGYFQGVARAVGTSI
jgi:hypothetical protein